MLGAPRQRPLPGPLCVGGEGGIDSACGLTPSGRRRAAPASCASAVRWLVEPDVASLPDPLLTRQRPLPGPLCVGGEGGIRTHGGRQPSTVFKTVAFNRSATSPDFLSTAPGAGEPLNEVLHSLPHVQRRPGRGGTDPCPLLVAPANREELDSGSSRRQTDPGTDGRGRQYTGNPP